MPEPTFLPRDQLSGLVTELARAGYTVVGPQVRDGAIVFAPMTSVDGLPRGIQDAQAPGHYRLSPVMERRVFDFACGPQAIKPLLFAGHQLLWTAQRTPEGFHAHMATSPEAAHPLAVVGVRACDLAALALHDAHFLGGEHQDPAYATRRAGLFLVAVNCARPAATCFCASTGDGPAAQYGYDLVVDELDEGYVIQAASAVGEKLLARLDTKRVSADQLRRAAAQRQAAAERQTRRLPGRDLQRAMLSKLEHARWEQVAERCLSCGNCTAVCPTCFCHAHVEDVALDGSEARHYRVWDSCFTEGHSYIHGIVIRADTRKRYRQWLTHKLATWHEQYGRSGCVGCGRCITWCPAGIDLTEEAAAIVGETA